MQNSEERRESMGYEEFLKDYNDKNGNNENIKNIELGTEHCILKKLFKTANRINSLNI